MSKKIKVSLLVLLSFILLMIFNESYARYVISKEITTTLYSSPFYFDVTPPTNQRIIFPRTTNTNDTDTILTTETTFNLVIKNNDGTNWNDFATTYQISIIDSPKFSFSDGSTITKTITGGASGKKNETISLKLKINNLENPSKTVKIRITTTSPYKKTIDLTLNVVQEGAIQSIEDLLDFSLAVRGDSKSKLLNPSTAIQERFKLTRDLDFRDTNSYENPYRTDYGNTNLDDYTDNLMTEMTSNAGFLPIGMLEYTFKGVFNGGNKTISNLRIHKSLQINIGFFGNTEGATVKNFTILNGDVENTNQTAGMAIGKVTGGRIENITVSGGHVTSRDLISEDRDTYTGGISGYTESGAVIKGCTNSAAITTRFTGDTATYSGPAGGITAWTSDSTIEDCTNNGVIVGQRYVGGISGFAGMEGGGTIRNCTNTGDVSTYCGDRYIGGIAGMNGANGLITGCTNTSSAYIHGGSNMGGIVGWSAGNVTNNTNNASSINKCGGYKNTCT